MRGTKKQLLNTVATISSVPDEMPPDEMPPDEMSPDELIPDPLVWEEFKITSMTLSRWTKDPKLNFPPPIKIRTRNFRSRRELEKFKLRMIQRSIEQRAKQKVA